MRVQNNIPHEEAIQNSNSYITFLQSAPCSERRFHPERVL